MHGFCGTLAYTSNFPRVAHAHPFGNRCPFEHSGPETRIEGILPKRALFRLVDDDFMTEAALKAKDPAKYAQMQEARGERHAMEIWALVLQHSGRTGVRGDQGAADLDTHVLSSGHTILYVL